MNRRLVIGALIAGLALLFLWLTGPKHIPHGAAVPSTAPLPSQHSEHRGTIPAVSHSDAAHTGVSTMRIASVSIARAKPTAPRPGSLASRIVEGARHEVRNGTVYRETYDVIPYPNGDVSPAIGVCTDLVICAFRSAGIDLQRRVHEDRTAHPSAYPTYLWDYKKPDANIDHRRCQNLYVYFNRHARSLTTSLDADHRADWNPGDVVFFKREGKKFPWHVAIISDRASPDGSTMILHLFPPRASEAPITRFLPIHSHFRWPAAEEIAGI